MLRHYAFHPEIPFAMRKTSVFKAGLTAYVHAVGFGCTAFTHQVSYFGRTNYGCTRAGSNSLTIGNVITTTSTWDQMVARSPFLIKHEEGHTWQYLYCLGLPYYIPYVIFMGWSVLRTGDRAARNFFERQAGLEIGGYTEYPVRPIGEGIRDVLKKLKLTRS